MAISFRRRPPRERVHYGGSLLTMLFALLARESPRLALPSSLHLAFEQHCPHTVHSLTSDLLTVTEMALAAGTVVLQICELRHKEFDRGGPKTTQPA